jgi:4-hydroxybenzoate polyprenyltransferase
MVCYTLHLAVWAAVIIWLPLPAWMWLGITAAAAIALYHYRLIATRSREGCFKAFRHNHWLGFAIFCGVLASYHLPALLKH